MSQRAAIQQILERMDDIRPIIINARPDDHGLRATTRCIIADLEALQRKPSISADTYLWLQRLTSRLLDAEHGALLRPDASGDIPANARISIEQHVEHRQSLLMDALQNMPAARRGLNQCCQLIGQKPTDDVSIQGKTRHLSRCLKKHLQHDMDLREELQQLVEALTPSLDAISTVMQEAGEKSPELLQIKQLLDQELPADAEQARAILQSARLGIVQAGEKMGRASAELRGTIQSNLDQLSEMSGKLEQAKAEARNDPLTGLPNRRQLAEFLQTMDYNGYSFIIADIDFFKKINDQYGHDAGDEVLRQLAMVLGESIRSTDLAARVGGEEFCIVFPATDMTTSARLAESLRQAVSLRPFKTTQGDISVSISIGLAEHLHGSPHADTFKAADKALYQAKENGRDQVRIARTT